MDHVSQTAFGSIYRRGQSQIQVSVHIYRLKHLLFTTLSLKGVCLCEEKRGIFVSHLIQRDYISSVRHGGRIPV